MTRTESPLIMRWRPGGETQAPSPRAGFALAAIDIDDTLIGPDGQIGAANRAAVETLRGRGVQIVLASGRSHENMLRFHRELGLGAGPIISAQGAVVRTAEGDETWHELTIAPSLVAAVTRDGLERGFTVQHYRRDGVFFQNHTSWNAYDLARAVTPHVQVDDLLAGGGAGVAKIIWLGPPAEIAHTVVQASKRYDMSLAICPTDPEYLEFSNVMANKAQGLAVVAERLGVARERVLAFGDGNNDAPMLAWAGLGVAMHHARPAAKEAADLIASAGDREASLARAVAQVLGTALQQTA